jgi:hypothetical protein
MENVKLLFDWMEGVGWERRRILRLAEAKAFNSLRTPTPLCSPPERLWRGHSGCKGLGDGDRR